MLGSTKSHMNRNSKADEKEISDGNISRLAKSVDVLQMVSRKRREIIPPSKHDIHRTILGEFAFGSLKNPHAVHFPSKYNTWKANVFCVIQGSVTTVSSSGGCLSAALHQMLCNEALANT